MSGPEYVVVTRHKGLVEWFVKNGYIEEGVTVIPHATVADVRGKHVIGVLPMALAVHALSVTELPMNIPAAYRGKDLDYEETERFRRGRPKTYKATYRDLPFIRSRKDWRPTT